MLRAEPGIAGFDNIVTPSPAAASGEPDTIDSAKAWLRLGVAVTLSTIGGVGMWSVVVALPAIQADFGVGRADASLPFTLVMIGFACGRSEEHTSELQSHVN